MRREGDGQPFYRGGYPGRPRGGGQAPLPRPWAGPSGRPLGGRQTPLFFYSRDFVANLKKKLHLNPVAPHRATGVYFLNFPKRTYIFEILIFLNIKKKKPPASRGRVFLVEQAMQPIIPEMSPDTTYGLAWTLWAALLQ